MLRPPRVKRPRLMPLVFEFRRMSTCPRRLIPSSGPGCQVGAGAASGVRDGDRGDGRGVQAVGVCRESICRWVAQADICWPARGGQFAGARRDQAVVGRKPSTARGRGRPERGEDFLRGWNSTHAVADPGFIENMRRRCRLPCQCRSERACFFTLAACPRSHWPNLPAAN